MAVAKIIEIISGSKKSFEHAMTRGIDRVNDSVNEVTSAWIKDQSVVVSKGKVIEYRVVMKVTFMVKNKSPDRKK